jgi:hypothetical protein
MHLVIRVGALIGMDHTGRIEAINSKVATTSSPRPLHIVFGSLRHWAWCMDRTQRTILVAVCPVHLGSCGHYTYYTGKFAPRASGITWSLIASSILSLCGVALWHLLEPGTLVNKPCVRCVLLLISRQPVTMGVSSKVGTMLEGGGCGNISYAIQFLLVAIP